MAEELRRKYNFKIKGRRFVLIKKAYESDFHVYSKAIIAAIYIDLYPGLGIEIKMHDRYKPDIVDTDERGRPVFWAECGAVSPDKIEHLLNKYRDTHFVFARQKNTAAAVKEKIMEVVGHITRKGRIEVIELPEDLSPFIDRKGGVHPEGGQVIRTRLD